MTQSRDSLAPSHISQLLQIVSSLPLFLSSPRILSLFQSILHFIVVCLYHTVYWNPFHIHSILHILLLISHTCYIPRYLISMSVDVNVRLMMMMSMRQPFFFSFSHHSITLPSFLPPSTLPFFQHSNIPKFPSPPPH